MAIPSIISIFTVLKTDVFQNHLLMLAALGPIVHFPFSFCLHLHRAFYSESSRPILYKLDVTFIHVHSFLQASAFDRGGQQSLINLIFHGTSIFFIWTNIDKNTNINKKTIDAITAIGVLLSSWPMFHIHQQFYSVSLIAWAIAFAIYSKKPFGEWSSAIFHCLLGIPQWCLLQAVLTKTK
jgi:hypothetical protein